MRKLIKVEQKYIDQVDKNYNAFSCPVACAIKDQLGLHWVKIYRTIELGGGRFCKAPRSVRRFVNNIDNQRSKDESTFRTKAKPFNFYLNLD